MLTCQNIQWPHQHTKQLKGLQLSQPKSTTMHSAMGLKAARLNALHLVHPTEIALWQSEFQNFSNSKGLPNLNPNITIIVITICKQMVKELGRKATSQGVPQKLLLVLGGPHMVPWAHVRKGVLYCPDSASSLNYKGSASLNGLST